MSVKRKLKIWSLLMLHFRYSWDLGSSNYNGFFYWILNDISQAVVEVCDTNNDGFIDFEEFKNLIMEAKSTYVKALFTTYDLDLDGFITKVKMFFYKIVPHYSTEILLIYLPLVVNLPHHFLTDCFQIFLNREQMLFLTILILCKILRIIPKLDKPYNFFNSSFKLSKTSVTLCQFFSGWNGYCHCWHWKAHQG